MHLRDHIDILGETMTNSYTPPTFFRVASSWPPLAVHPRCCSARSVCKFLGLQHLGVGSSRSCLATVLIHTRQ